MTCVGTVGNTCWISLSASLPPVFLASICQASVPAPAGTVTGQLTLRASPGARVTV